MSGRPDRDGTATPGPLARLLLGLYPAAWRARYGVEMADLVARRGLSVRGAADLLRGAVDAHLHLPALLPGWTPARRDARLAVVVLAAAAAYAAAVGGLLETRDQVSYAGSPARLTGVVLADLAWLALAVAGVACAAGALVVLVAALRRMRATRSWRALRFVVAPATACLLAMACGVALGHAGPHGLPHAVAGALFVGWLLGLALCAALCVRSAARLLDVVTLPASVWPALRRLTRVAVVAVAAGALAVVAYPLAFALVDPALLGAPDGLLATPLLPTLLGAAVLGVAAAALALGAWRGGGREPVASGRA